MKTRTPRCGARTKQGDHHACRLAAGAKTDHPGQGRCHLHGGKTPVRTGRYSTIKRESVQSRLAELKTNDRDPMNLADEVLLLRALTIDYIERYDAFMPALIAWHDSYIDLRKTPNPKPTQIVDVADAGRLLEMISRVVERMHKMRETSSVTVAAVRHLMDQMGLVLTKHVQDGEVLDAITRDWAEIQIDPHAADSD
jgi:hypothetical protein